jgi:hypothetical protein
MPIRSQSPPLPVPLSPGLLSLVLLSLGLLSPGALPAMQAPADDFPVVGQRLWLPDTAVSVEISRLLPLSSNQTLLLATSNHLLGDLRPMLALFDVQLQEQWAVNLGDSRFTSDLTAVLALANGDLLVAGSAQQSTVLQVRMRESGALLWQQVVPAEQPIASPPPAIAEDPASGRIFVAAVALGDLQVHSFHADGTPGLTVVLDNGGLNHAPNALAVLQGSRLALVTQAGTDHTHQYRTYLLDSTGELVGTDVEAGDLGKVQTTAALWPDDDGVGVRILGGPESTCGVFESRLWALGADATRLWTQVFPPDAPCFSALPIGMDAAADGGLYLAHGELDASGLQRIDADGTQRWLRSTRDVRDTGMVATALAAIPSHHVLLVGFEPQPWPQGRRAVAVLWDSRGHACRAGVLSATGAPRHVIAHQDGRWLVAMQSRDQNEALVADLRQYALPDDCVDQDPDPKVDPMFSDGFEAAARIGV